MDQESLTDAEIEQSIYTGVDCCRDALYPYKSIHITPSKTTIKPGENVYLVGKNITRECDPACYHWRIIRGGGSLSEDFGHATKFYAPSDFDECNGSAQVALFCSGAIVDICYIGVNAYTQRDIAFSLTTNRFVWIKPGDYLFGRKENTRNWAQPYDMLCLVVRFYDCSGNLIKSGCRVSAYKESDAFDEAAFKEKAAPAIGQFFDLRTPDMKKRRCCPGEILAHEE